MLHKELLLRSGIRARSRTLSCSHRTRNTPYSWIARPADSEDDLRRQQSDTR